MDDQKAAGAPATERVLEPRDAVRLVLLIAGTVFTIEAGVMALLSMLPRQPAYLEWLIDAGVLVTGSLPVLYVGLYRPLRRQILERQRAQAQAEALVGKLQGALDEIKTLRGIIPICMSCKKVRDDRGYWHQVEVYVSSRSLAEFTHGLCEACLDKLYPESPAGS
jgi:hypothetical protein